MPAARPEHEDEVVFSRALLSPSLANDNLSGIAVATWMARELVQQQRSEPRRRLSYRFIFGPTTPIGSIAWLARREASLPRVRRHGLSLACLGNRAPCTTSAVAAASAATDRIASSIVRDQGGHVLAFEPYGYDERRFCSPGIDRACGRLTRHAQWPACASTTPRRTIFRSCSRMRSRIRSRRCGGSSTASNATSATLNLSPRGEPRLGARPVRDASPAAAGPL
jgi:aminopeptidase-like protein